MMSLIMCSTMICLVLAILENISAMFIVVKKLKCQSSNWVIKTYYIPCLLYAISISIIAYCSIALNVSIRLSKSDVLILILESLAFMLVYIGLAIRKVNEAKRRVQLAKLKNKANKIKSKSNKDDINSLLDKIYNSEKRIRVDKKLIEEVSSELNSYLYATSD